MNTDIYDSFLVLCGTLNFSDAAQRLHKTQSVLSRQISALEEELGFDLFIRDSKKVVLTDSGIRFQNGILSLKDQYGRLIEEAKAINEGKSGHLTLAIANGETNAMFYELVDGYSRQNPNTDISFITYEINNTADLLSNNKVDCLFTVGTNPWFSSINRPGFCHIKVGVRHDFLYIPASHPLADRPESELSLADFKDDTFLYFGGFEVNPKTGPLSKTLKRAGISPKCRQCSSLSDIIAGMLNEKCVCIGSNRLLLYNFPQYRKLRLNGLDSHDEIMLWNSANPNKCITAFTGYVQQYLLSHPDFNSMDVLMKA